MLDKKFDLVIVGKSYLSIMLAVKMMRRNLKVLLLDDERVDIGSLYSDFFGPIESTFISSWGEDNHLTSLSNVKKYLTARPYSIVVGQTRVKLGHRPSQNLIELYRKLSPYIPIGHEAFFELIGDEAKRESFDSECEKLFQRIGKSSYFFKSLQGLSLDSFLSMSPKGVISIYEAFSQVIKKEQFENKSSKWFFQSFLMAARGIFHKKIDCNLSEIEMFHLLLSLLQPSFELDSKSLMEDLVLEFEKVGGIYKSCQLREWKFHKNKPWAIELSSYEGIVHPDKVVFIGGSLDEMPIIFPNKDECLRDVVIDWKIEGLDSHLTGERFFFTDVNKVGTDVPLWFADFHQGHIHFKVFTLYEKGSKLSFVKDFLRETLKKDLKSLISNVDELLIEESISYGKELWPSPYKKSTWFPKKVSIYDHSRPGFNDKLNGVHYFGPYRETPLGLLSSMMDINEMHQFI